MTSYTGLPIYLELVALDSAPPKLTVEFLILLNLVTNLYYYLLKFTHC